MSQVTLRGSVEYTHLVSSLNQDADDEQIVRMLDNRYSWNVVVDDDWLFARGMKPYQSGQRYTKERKVYLRGEMVYALPKEEFKKSFGLIFLFPVITLVEKIFIPVFVYYPLKILSMVTHYEYFNQVVKNFEDEEFMHCRKPERALIGLIAHPIISALGLIPCFSNYFNKMNGDLERYINGHTDFDLETKSASMRAKEGCYIALCQQPLFKFPRGRVSMNLDVLTGDNKALAFRALAGAPFTSKKPIIKRIV